MFVLINRYSNESYYTALVSEMCVASILSHIRLLYKYIYGLNYVSQYLNIL